MAPEFAEGDCGGEWLVRENMMDEAQRQAIKHMVGQISKRVNSIRAYSDGHVSQSFTELLADELHGIGQELMVIEAITLGVRLRETTTTEGGGKPQ